MLGSPGVLSCSGGEAGRGETAKIGPIPFSRRGGPDPELWESFRVRKEKK